MEVIRNVLTVVGLVAVVRYTVKGFNKHLKKPLEDQLTQIFDDEVKNKGYSQKEVDELVIKATHVNEAVLKDGFFAELDVKAVKVHDYAQQIGCSEEDISQLYRLVKDK